LNQAGDREDATVIVRGKFQNGDSSADVVLLVADVLVRSDEQIELSLGAAEQFPELVPENRTAGEVSFLGTSSKFRVRLKLLAELFEKRKSGFSKLR